MAVEEGQGSSRGFRRFMLTAATLELVWLAALVGLIVWLAWRFA